jgi:hypothetical protein
MSKKSKVRGPDGKLYEVEGGEVYEAPEDQRKKKRKEPGRAGQLTPDPHGAHITPEERGAQITPEGHGADITPEQHGGKIKP